MHIDAFGHVKPREYCHKTAPGMDANAREFVDARTASRPLALRDSWFVPSQETAQHIRGIRQWVTNEYAHSGIRDDGARIFEQLLAMTRGSIPLC